MQILDSRRCANKGFNLSLSLIVGLFVLILIDSVRADDKEIPVKISLVESNRLVDKIPLTGSATPQRQSLISPEVDGLIVRVLVDDGDEVVQGQELVKLDNVIADIEVDQAAAALAEGREAWREAVRQRDESAKLVSKRHVAETTYKALIADAQMKKAVLTKLNAEHRRALESSKRFVIRAPFDGVVGNTLVELGQWVDTGDAILELYDISVLRVRVEVPQRYFSLINVGTPVQLTFDALPKQTFDATVSKKIPIANATGRTFPVRIDVANSNRSIAPGMSVRVNFLIGDQVVAPVVMVPRDAVVKSADGSEIVWRVSSKSGNKIVNPVRIKIGRWYQSSVEIVDGSINPGDQVVIRGNEILKPGQRVRLAH